MSIESGKGVLWPAAITVTSRALSVTGDAKPGSSGRIAQFSEGGRARRRKTSVICRDVKQALRA